MTTYLKGVYGTPPASSPVSVQTAPDQIPDSDGAFVYAVTPMQQLMRFLILGTEGGSYYATEQKLTRENASNVEAAIKADGLAVVDAIVAVSEGGRAAKNDPALFALAMCASFGDAATRSAALDALPRVARIGTHLFHFAGFLDGLRGWGRGLRTAIGAWYTDKPASDLAFQIAKYQARDGWSHRDLLRLSHPKVAPDSVHQHIFHYVTKGWEGVGDAPHTLPELNVIWCLEKLKQETTEAEVLRMIDTYRLPLEVIPSEKHSPAVYERMIETAGLTWLIRNLGNLSKHEVIKTGQFANLNKVVARLTDEESIRKSRVHPLAVLVAQKTYAQGHGMRGGNSWQVIPQIVTALDDAFEMAFQNVEPTGKRFVLGLDISGSMGGPDIAGMPGISPRIGTAAMALITARSERNVTAMAFEGQFVPFPIGARDSLTTVIRQMEIASQRMGNTDCSLPMAWATQNKIESDAFVIYTDSETNSGVHPDYALKQYRQKMGIDAKFIVVGMVANGFSVGDPKDAGTLNVVGFDTATPGIISEFAAGRL